MIHNVHIKWCIDIVINSECTGSTLLPDCCRIFSGRLGDAQLHRGCGSMAEHPYQTMYKAENTFMRHISMYYQKIRENGEELGDTRNRKLKSTVVSAPYGAVRNSASYFYDPRRKYGKYGK